MNENVEVLWEKNYDYGYKSCCCCDYHASDPIPISYSCHPLLSFPKTKNGFSVVHYFWNRFCHPLNDNETRHFNVRSKNDDLSRQKMHIFQAIPRFSRYLELFWTPSDLSWLFRPDIGVTC